MGIVEDRPHNLPAAAAALHKLSQEVATEQQAALATFAQLLCRQAAAHTPLIAAHCCGAALFKHQHGFNADPDIGSVL
jgi:hypothetical protein